MPEPVSWGAGNGAVTSPSGASSRGLSVGCGFLGMDPADRRKRIGKRHSQDFVVGVEPASSTTDNST